MARLSEVFDSIRLEDGRPDLVGRRAELDNLLGALSIPEKRHVRARLEVSPFYRDPCGDTALPLEILADIAQYLDPDDFLRASCVSRKWKERWSSPDIYMVILKNHFPVEYDNWDAAGRGNSHPEARQEFAQRLPALANSRVKRKRGQFTSVRSYSHDNHFRPFPLYCAGRLAFDDGSRISVVNFNTGSQRVYATDDREQFSRHWISDRLLISYLLSPKSEDHISLSNWNIYSPRLIIWSLIFDDVYRLRLPKRIQRLSVDRDRVLIILATNMILYWQVDRPLREIDLKPSDESIFREHGFRDRELVTSFFHPRRENHFFLVFKALNPKDPSLRSFLIQEFYDGLSKLHYDAMMGLSGPRQEFKFMMTDEHLINLITPKRYVHEDCPCKGSSEPTGLHPSKKLMFCTHILSITFDIYEKRFMSRCYHLPDDLSGQYEIPNSVSYRFSGAHMCRFYEYGRTTAHGSISIQMSQNQALTVMKLEFQEENPMQPAKPADMVVIALKPCNELYEQRDQGLWYDIDDPDEALSGNRIPIILSESDKYFKSDVDFYWNISAEYLPRTSLQEEESWIVGDEKFKVLVIGRTFTVFCFDESFEFPPLENSTSSLR